MWNVKTRKRLVLLQALAVLMAVFQYGHRTTGPEEGGDSNRILSNTFYPYLTARLPLAGSGKWLARTANHAHFRIQIQIHRSYCGVPLLIVFPRILIGILCTYGIRTARTIWCCYSAILKSAIFCTLTECGGLVNEMLLMMAGDVESNPGPTPTMPQNLKVEVVVGEVALKVSWDAPRDNSGHPVLSYTVQIREVVEIETATDFATLTPLPVVESSQVHFIYSIRDSHNFHLTKNAVYEVQVAASNIAGPGPTSTARGSTLSEGITRDPTPVLEDRVYTAAARDRLLIQRHIEQQGSLKMNSHKMLICGLPCTGKTTAMLRLSNQLRCLDPKDSPIPSTGFEKPITVELYKKTVKQSAMITGVAEWKYQNLEQQGQTLYSRILQSSSRSTPSAVVTSSSSQSVVASSSGAEEQSLHTSEEDDDVLPLTSLVKAQDWNAVREKLMAIEDVTILHTMDCGGHSECHEILPLLLEGPSLSLIFLNLTHDLDKTYQVVFRGKEGPSSIEYIYESVFTAREVLQRLLCMISSLQSCAHKERQVALLVGSYLDHSNEEAVLTLNTSIQETFKSFIEKDILFPANVQEGKYIATLDNMSEDRGDIEELRKVIHTIIETRFQPEPIPTAWLMLHLLLHDKYEREPGWCTVEECVEVATACGIKMEELLGENGILRYIHKHYGTLLYYPTVPGLCDKVICDPNIILHPFTRTFLFPSACSLGHIQTAKSIRATGEIPHDLMEIICATKSADPIPTSEIVALLQDRYILYKSIRNAAGTRKYFMPCLLQPDPSVGVEASKPITLSSLNPAPLLFVPCSTGFVPLSLFPALVVEMFHTWDLKEGERFRNRIKFRVRQKGKPTRKVEFLQHPSYLELRLLPLSRTVAPEATDFSILTSCRQQLWKALGKVSSKYPHMRDVVWQFGFYCPGGLQPGGQPHSAVCLTGEEIMEAAPVDMECFQKPCCKEEVFFLEDKHESWFKDLEPPEEIAAARDRLLIQRYIEQQGEMEMKSYKMLLCGLPRTGKTTAMLRLSNQLQYIDPNDSPNPSTGFEKPQTVELQRTVKQSILIAGVGGKVEWKCQDLEQQGQTLYSCFLKSPPSSKSSLVSTSSSQPDVASSSGAKEQSLVTLTNEPPALDEEKQATTLTSPVKTQVWNSVSSQSTVASSNAAEELTSKDELSQSTTLKEENLATLLASLVKAQKWNEVRKKLETIEDVTILHMMDCGGHPECHEILPLLLEGRALSLIFLNLDHDLDKKYWVKFQGKEGAGSIEYESVFTAKVVLQRILCSISSLQSGTQCALLVGTHLDQLAKETIQETVLARDRSVQEALQSYIKKDILFPASDQDGKLRAHDDTRYIVTLDNTSKDQGDIEELRKAILTIIDTKFQKESVPPSLLLLHLLLRTKHEKQPGWCTLNECVEVATACGIKKEHLLRKKDGILRYIHEHYGTLLYYPNVPGLCDKVICDPNIILNVFSRIFVFVYACNPGHKMAAKSIRDTGEISHELMETICTTKSADPIPASEIVALLKDRYILYVVKTCMGPTSYFMPCLLPPDPSAEASKPTTLSSLKSAPLLLIPRSTGYVPLGLFPALVVKMSHTWHLKEKEKRFRNRIQFRVIRTGKQTRSVEFLQHPSNLELRLLPLHVIHTVAPEATDFSVLTTCRQQLWEALREVSSKYPHMRDVVWRFGFYCPGGLQRGRQPHSAVCLTKEEIMETAPVDMECFQKPCCEEEDFLLENKHKSWFKDLEPPEKIGTSPRKKPATSQAEGQELAKRPKMERTSPRKRPATSQAEGQEFAKRPEMEPADETPVSTSQASCADADKELNGSDLLEISSYLDGMENSKILRLGMVLGLDFSKLKNNMTSTTFLLDTIYSWLHKEDEVVTKGIPTWRALVNGLKSRGVRQTGIATEIAKDKGIE